MKTFFKQNIIISLIWNLPYTIAISSVLLYLNFETLSLWVLIIAIHGFISMNTVKTWYKEEKFDKLEKRVKELEDRYVKSKLKR